MTAALPASDSTPVTDAEFTDAIGAVKARRGVSADTVLRLAGPVLMPLGLVCIVLAWFGTAYTTRVFLQIPYLVSGGLLGLAFVFLGGFAYFARFSLDQLAESRRQADEAGAAAERTIEALARIETLLAETAAASAPAPRRRQIRASGGDWVVTAKGELLHRADCSAVAGRDTTVVGEPDDRARYCRLCSR